MRLMEVDFEQVRERVPNLWSLVKSPEQFWGDLDEHGRRLLKQLLQGTLELWRDQWVEVEWHKPSPHRRTWRNGYFVRKRWDTPLGRLHDVRIPRCRDRGLTQAMYARLKDHQQAMGDSVIEMLLAGVSTRRVGELLETILDMPVSATRVSQLSRRLDAEVRGWHTRPLADRYRYLILDAIWLRARGQPRLLARQQAIKRTRKCVVLVAYGIRDDGRRELIDFRLARQETKAAWEAFCLNLHRRGLVGRRLNLITTDGNRGLIAAVQRVWGHVLRQRCWFHKMANIAACARRADRGPLLRGLRAVYDAPSRLAAERAACRWAEQWRSRYPKAVERLERDLDQLLAIYSVPAEDRRGVRTTNAIERCFREVRRKTNRVGVFPDDSAVERLIFGLLSYLNQRYARQPSRQSRRRERTDVA